MNLKALITALVLAGTSTAALADSNVRDHRDATAQPTADMVRDHRVDHGRRVESRPSWMINARANVNYGFQVDRDGDEVQPYQYGQDPSPEYTPRSSWVKLATQLRLNISSSVTVPVNQHFSVLELQAQWAGLQVNQVRVLLNDGRTITVAANRMLDRTAAPNLRIDLGEQARCGIRSVTVYGSGGGTFGILGA